MLEEGWEVDCYNCKQLPKVCSGSKLPCWEFPFCSHTFTVGRCPVRLFISPLAESERTLNLAWSQCSSNSALQLSRKSTRFPTMWRTMRWCHGCLLVTSSRHQKSFKYNSKRREAPDCLSTSHLTRSYQLQQSYQLLSVAHSVAHTHSLKLCNHAG